MTRITRHDLNGSPGARESAEPDHDWFGTEPKKTKEREGVGLSFQEKHEQMELNWKEKRAHDLQDQQSQEQLQKSLFYWSQNKQKASEQSLMALERMSIDQSLGIKAPFRANRWMNMTNEEFLNEEKSSSSEEDNPANKGGLGDRKVATQMKGKSMPRLMEQQQRLKIVDLSMHSED